MIFNPEDIGLWYLSPEERDWQRHNQGTGKRKLVERSKKMRVHALAAEGVSLQQQRNHTKKELQEFATKRDGNGYRRV